MLPLCKTTMWSASTMVLSRCAMTMRVAVERAR
jgi:hypothetical protein